MKEIKDSPRSTVRIGYDSRVHKTFHGNQAQQRFTTEVKVLKYLEEKGCPFVPKLLEHDPTTLRIVTSNCGQIVDKMGDAKVRSLFKSLEAYGVIHDDPFLRNITYDHHAGRFCIIDFEYATLIEEQSDSQSAPESTSLAPATSPPPTS